MVTHGPRKIVPRTPLPSSVSLVAVLKDPTVRLSTSSLHSLAPKFPKAEREREFLSGRSFPGEPSLAAWVARTFMQRK